MIILSAGNITYRIDEEIFLREKREKVILDNISFEIIKGEITGIAGESGSGKTTLIKILAGILKPTVGNIIINTNVEWKKLSTKPVQILFQNNGEILNPFREIETVIEETLTLRFGKDINITEEKKKIFNSINFHEHLRRRKGFELSGGEQQRAALARILAVHPEILILDEPFSAQDPESQMIFLNLFKKIKDEFNLTIICVTHNLKILRKIADKVIILYKGKIVEHEETKNIFLSPKHPYTKFLLKAENYELTPDELKYSQMRNEQD
jgi:peptide/nickel transport system ATP-binding protein